VTTVTKWALSKERGKKESVLVDVGANERADIYGSLSSNALDWTGRTTVIQ